MLSNSVLKAIQFRLERFSASLFYPGEARENLPDIFPDFPEPINKIQGRSRTFQKRKKTPELFKDMLQSWLDDKFYVLPKLNSKFNTLTSI